ncbi:unnamed protein product, partial [Echinostoma caproni]|uniref:Btz domain-containing protein n=1 Tax=Echinostoma caproni TaxID=27848 RepID=A0A183A2M1_9TREM
MLIRQEQRAKERSQWFEQHRARSDYRHNGTSDEKHAEPANPDAHGRYGRPRFDPKQSGI